MPKIDIAKLRVYDGTDYPEPFRKVVAGRSRKRLGAAAGFKANSRNGHHLVNRSSGDVVYLEIGTRAKRERVEYPDVDLVAIGDEQGKRYTHKDGRPYL